MVKLGNLKYIHSDIDPKQLYDLGSDPYEQSNLIGNPDYADAQQQLADLVASEWDIETLKQDIILSQRRRLFLRDALAKGEPTDWDFIALDQNEEHCLRADKVYSEWAYQGIIGFKVPE